MSDPVPEVIQTLELSSNWNRVAVQRLINFFDQRRQLRNAYRGEKGQWRLVVAFTDDKQAEAFRLALEKGELKRN